MKAVIMAGGEGTRLRPLTCDCPKPMIQLMNRPVMQHALSLLKKHGVTQIAATLGYLPDAITDYFGDGDDFGVDLRYYIENTPLGTAGGVRRAADFLDETFAVLSGDGVTDLDLSRAAEFHREKGAVATLVLKRSDNPLDYGVVAVDGEGRVERFLEKPDWSGVIAETVNTGIYILEPEALRRVPEDRPWDFGHDLFPTLLREGLPVYGWVTSAYWCDIGDVRAYLAAHIDALEGRIRLEGLTPGPGRVAQLPGAKVDRSAMLEGPCVIGPDARVLAGARVGPHTVVGRGCVIGEGAGAKRCVLWPGAALGAGAQARGCVLARGATIGEGAQAYEESVLGTGASIGRRSVLLPGVKLWPGKQGGDGARLESSLVWGNRRGPAFSSGRLSAEDPGQMLRAAQAVAEVLKPRLLLLGSDGSASARALWHAAASGFLAQGTEVLAAEDCPLPQLRQAQRALGCDAAALVGGEAILPLGERGARLPRPVQRSILARLARQDFARPFAAGHPALRSAGDTSLGYVAQAAGRFRADPRRVPPVALYAEDAALLSLAERSFLRAGLVARTVSSPSEMALGPGELGVCLTEAGEGCALCDEDGCLCDAQSQLLLAWTALESGERTLPLPAHATRAIEALCRERDARAEYLSGEDALWMNALADRSPALFELYFDGIQSALRQLSALTASGLDLKTWRGRMPAVSRRSRRVDVSPRQTGRLMSALAQSGGRAEPGGGLRFRRDDGWAWVCPEESGQGFRVVAEAADAEAARELCDFCEGVLRRLSREKKDS